VKTGPDSEMKKKKLPLRFDEEERGENMSSRQIHKKKKADCYLSNSEKLNSEIWGKAKGDREKNLFSGRAGKVEEVQDLPGKEKRRANAFALGEDSIAKKKAMPQRTGKKGLLIPQTNEGE